MLHPSKVFLMMLLKWEWWNVCHCNQVSHSMDAPTAPQGVKITPLHFPFLNSDPQKNRSGRLFTRKAVASEANEEEDATLTDVVVTGLLGSGGGSLLWRNYCPFVLSPLHHPPSTFAFQLQLLHRSEPIIGLFFVCIDQSYSLKVSFCKKKKKKGGINQHQRVSIVVSEE